MQPDYLSPPEAWTAAEEQIDLWQEERRTKEPVVWTSYLNL